MKYKVTTERTEDGQETTRFTKIIEMSIGKPRVGDTSQTLNVPPITNTVVAVTLVEEEKEKDNKSHGSPIGPMVNQKETDNKTN